MRLLSTRSAGGEGGAPLQGRGVASGEPAIEFGVSRQHVLGDGVEVVSRMSHEVGYRRLDERLRPDAKVLRSLGQLGDELFAEVDVHEAKSSSFWHSATPP